MDNHKTCQSHDFLYFGYWLSSFLLKYLSEEMFWAAANFVFQSGKNVLPLSPVSLSLSLSFLALFPILFAAEEASVSAAISFFIGGLSGLETTCVQWDFIPRAMDWGSMKPQDQWAVRGYSTLSESELAWPLSWVRSDLSVLFPGDPGGAHSFKLSTRWNPFGTEIVVGERYL